MMERSISWVGPGVRFAGLVAGSLSSEIRKIHRSRLYRRPLLLQHRQNGGGDLCGDHFLYLCSRANAGRRGGFSRCLEVPINTGVYIGMAIVFFYAVLGGMKGITYTQVAQYCILIFAYMVPAIFISLAITGNLIPQLGFGSNAERWFRHLPARQTG